MLDRASGNADLYLITRTCGGKGYQCLVGGCGRVGIWVCEPDGVWAYL